MIKLKEWNKVLEFTKEAISNIKDIHIEMSVFSMHDGDMTIKLQVKDIFNNEFGKPFYSGFHKDFEGYRKAIEKNIMEILSM